MKLSLDGDSLINHLPWLSGPRFGNHLLHLPPLPPLSTPLLLLLPLGVIPSLHRCAQKRERSRSAVDAGEPIEQEDAHGERNALWKKKRKKKPLCSGGIKTSKRGALSVSDQRSGLEERSRRNTERLFIPPLQQRREETRRGGKIPLNAVRAPDEEKRRAEGIG